MEGYKEFIRSNGEILTVESIPELYLAQLTSLEELTRLNGIYSESGINDYIDLLCVKFEIDQCNKCKAFYHISSLLICKDCSEYICQECECCNYTKKKWGDSNG